jgi:hypothetical protein
MDIQMIIDSIPARVWYFTFVTSGHMRNVRLLQTIVTTLDEH